MGPATFSPSLPRLFPCLKKKSGVFRGRVEPARVERQASSTLGIAPESGGLSYRGMVAWQAPERWRLDYRISGSRELLVALLVWSEPMKGAQFRFKPAANRTWSRQLPLGTKGELRLFYASRRREEEAGLTTNEKPSIPPEG